MGSRSKMTHHGDLLIPGALMNLLDVAAHSVAPTAEDADTARGVTRKFQAARQSHFVSAKRLREHHKWTAEQAAEPWATNVAGLRGVVIVPKRLRYAAAEVVKQAAVTAADVMPHDDDDLADKTQEWVEIGNSGKGKPIWRYDSWTRLAFESKSAEWLKKGLAAAITPRAGQQRAAVEPGPDSNMLVGWANDVCRYWTNPTPPRPALTGDFDAHGELRVGGVTEVATPAQALEAGTEAYQDALAMDAEADAAAPPKPADPAKISRDA